MYLPTEMALALFDSLETSYLSAISLRKYFFELEIGNFPEGQSIREQSSSILSGHTIWDVFEYRLFQTFVKMPECTNFASDLAKNISDLVAQLADHDCTGYLDLNIALCESIVVDSLAEISQSLCPRRLTALHVKSRELASQAFAVWIDVLIRLARILVAPKMKQRQNYTSKLIFLTEELGVVSEI